MADFCLSCWNRINQTNHRKIKYVFSKELAFCEGCGKMCKVIEMERSFYYKQIVISKLKNIRTK